MFKTKNVCGYIKRDIYSMVHVASSARQTGTPGDFTFQPSGPLAPGVYCLTGLSLMNTAPPVDRLSKLVVAVGGGSPTHVEIGIDCYSLDALKQALPLALDAATGGSWAVSVSDDTQRVSLSQTGGVSTTIYPERDEHESFIASVLGIYEPVEVSTNGVAVFGHGVVSMAHPEYYCIHVAGATGQEGVGEPTFRIPCNVGSFSMIMFRPTIPMFMRLSQTMPVLSVHLTDDRGRRLSQRSGLGSDWSMTLSREDWGVRRVSSRAAM